MVERAPEREREREREGVRGNLRRGREHNEVLLVLGQHLLHRTCEPFDLHDALEVVERPVLHTLKV